MGARMRAFDWTTTPLGPPEAWPQHLKNAIALFSAARRRHPQERAARERARSRAAIEEAPLAIALTGPSGEILLRNPRFDQLWGRPAHTTTAPHLQRRVTEGYHLDGRRIASEEWPGARDNPAERAAAARGQGATGPRESARRR